MQKNGKIKSLVHCVKKLNYYLNSVLESINHNIKNVKDFMIHGVGNARWTENANGVNRGSYNQFSFNDKFKKRKVIFYHSFFLERFWGFSLKSPPIT